MYGKGAGIGAATTATTATVGAIALPDTGSNFVVTLAISVVAGMLVWGVLYARSNAASAK